MFRYSLFLEIRLGFNLSGSPNGILCLAIKLLKDELEPNELHSYSVQDTHPSLHQLRARRQP